MESLYHDLVAAEMRTEPHISAALVALETAHAAGRAAYEAEVERQMQYDGTGSYDYPLMDHLHRARATLPAGWREASTAASRAARAGAARARGWPRVPTEQEALAEVARRLGWRRGSVVVSLAKYTVKMGTMWLRAASPGDARLQGLMSAFCTMVGPSTNACMTTPRLLETLWELPWENQNKEVFWRLVLNGLPTAARMGMMETCACGEEGLHGRLHYFYHCAVAKHLLQEIGAALGRSHDRPVTQSELLHASCPSNCFTGVWQVVTLAATDALWRAVRTGRRAMMKPKRGRAPAAKAGPDLANQLGRLAVAYFWDRMADFCALNKAPVAWRTVCSYGLILRWLPAEAKWIVQRRPA